MAEIVTMPRLSDTMEEGVVATWIKKIGDKVSEGDILAEIETDKTTMEFESFHEGTLLHIGVAEGEGAPVDSLLCIIGEEGEDISALLQKGTAEKAVETPAIVETPVAVEKEAVDMLEEIDIVTMPRLSDTMEEGTVASWIKKVGDTVEEGDILAEIETDKATMEFESFYTGTLLHIGIQEGESAKVDSVLAIIGPAGTDVAPILKQVAQGESAEAALKTETPKTEAVSHAVEEEKPVVQASGGRILASPLAKKIAKDKGIDLSTVKGSGEHGRIIKRDIESYKPAATSQTSAVPVQSFVPAGESGESVKNSPMRKTIAKRLAESKFTAPHYYLTVEMDMEHAMASRKKINDLPDIKVSFNDMIVKACAMALRKHPQVNSTWNNDTTEIHKDIHVGVAVAVDDGLVVPVLKHTDHMSLTQIGSTVRDLAGKARGKKIQPAEMEGSTFTVSNLGMFGIVEFTSIINQPNSAILSVGAIIEKPVVKNGQIVVGNTMKVTLACDHRTVDGATGAQFLQTLKAFVENPVNMLA